MDSTNNNQMFLSEFKELRNELSAVKKRIDQLEESHEKQQEKINFLESENKALKTQLNNIDDNKAVGLTLKRKRKDQVDKEEIKSKSTSTSALTSTDNKKAKTNNNNGMLPICDNGDSFDSLSDDLLHKIIEFDGNCYSKFGLINKRCKNIYDVEEYKLKKQTYVYGYGTVEMMLERYLQKRRENKLGLVARFSIARGVIWYNRLDAIDWMVQLGDSKLLIELCCSAAYYGKINILSKVFCKLNLTMLDQLLNDTELCFEAADNGHLETLKWVRKYDAEWSETTFIAARQNNHDEMVQYLRAEGCPEPHPFEY